MHKWDEDIVQCWSACSGFDSPALQKKKKKKRKGEHTLQMK